MTVRKQAGADSAFIRLIYAVEKLGNLLPHPFFLFLYLGLAVLVLSVLMQGVTVSYEVASATGITQTSVSVVNLLSSGYLRTVMKNWVGIYVNFAPLGLVMVMMLAIGFAQYTGLFDAFMKRTLLGAPAMLTTFTLALVGATSSVASNAGIIFGATIGAALFASLNRNPILGCVTGYAAAHGGFSACLVPCGTDVTLAAITQTATEAMGITAPTHPLINFYFVFTATFTVAIAVTFVTEKIACNVVKEGVASAHLEEPVTEAQKRGLRWAGVGLGLFTLLLIALSVPEGAFFRATDGSLVPASPLIDSIVAILFFFFIFVGAGYGLGAGTIKSKADVATFMGKGMSDSISFFVMAFPAALFIQLFNDSKIANIIAVNGADLLTVMNIDGIPLALAFIILCTFCNLFMTSATSKWLILAPIFVPMFYHIGFSPALTQTAFRVADSAANPIAPINFFLPIVLGVMNRYKKADDPDYGLGTLLSYMMPYSIAIMVVLVLQLIIWMLFSLPLGPGVSPLI
jgi:aminobenzoyl-glutamate transport protein